MGRKKRKKIARPDLGTPPGTLSVSPDASKTVMRVIAYGPDGYEEKQLVKPDDARAFIEKWPVTWFNVDGVGDTALIERIGDLFGLHRLALEDAVVLHQRPKVDAYEPHLFIVSRMVHLDERLETEQISMFLGRQLLITFQEYVGDCLEPVRERIRKGAGRVRNNGPDYLACCLVDALVDAYYPVLERYGERLEDLEDQILKSPRPSAIGEVHRIKRDLLTVRRAVWPQREAISSLVRDPSEFVTDETRLYLRDVYDHTVQTIDMVETFRELGSGLQDIYLSSLSNRMNEVMKVLTIIATIFIPLTFIVGVYGMNFEFMPEIHWKWAYGAVWIIMLLVALGMVIYFRRKGWLGNSKDGAEEEEKE